VPSLFSFLFLLGLPRRCLQSDRRSTYPRVGECLGIPLSEAAPLRYAARHMPARPPRYLPMAANRTGGRRLPRRPPFFPPFSCNDESTLSLERAIRHAAGMWTVCWRWAPLFASPRPRTLRSRTPPASFTVFDGHARGAGGRLTPATEIAGEIPSGYDATGPTVVWRQDPPDGGTARPQGPGER
jgi:hypothetical protein